MIDIESRIVDSLKARAHQDAPADGLRERALARAATLRRRRRTFAAAAGAGLAVVLTAGVAAVPRLLPGGGSLRSHGFPAAAPTDPVPARSGPTTLPRADGVPPAADRPADVGTDPSLLHFDVDIAAFGADASEWTSSAGFEQATLLTADNRSTHAFGLATDPAKLFVTVPPPAPAGEVHWYTYDAAGHPQFDLGPEEPVTIAGRPGTLQRATARRAREVPTPSGTVVTFERGRDSEATGPTWVLRWQPVPGLHAMVQVGGGDRAAALAAVAALRLDRAQRCVAPLRLQTTVGTTWTECQTVVRRRPLAGRGVWVRSQLILRAPDGRRISVWTEEARRPRPAYDTSQFIPNLTVAGYPGQWRTADPRGLWVLNFGVVELFVSGGVSRRDAVRLAGNLAVVGDLARPDTWPWRAVT